MYLYHIYIYHIYVSMIYQPKNDVSLREYSMETKVISWALQACFNLGMNHGENSKYNYEVRKPSAFYKISFNFSFENYFLFQN